MRRTQRRKAHVSPRHHRIRCVHAAIRSITNDELVAAFNAYVERYKTENADAIAAGEVEAKGPVELRIHPEAAGIEQRYVMDKEGVLDPDRMYPKLRPRSDDEPAIMAEMGLDACEQGAAAGGADGRGVDLVICAASNHERAYPAIAIEIQRLLGAGRLRLRHERRLLLGHLRHPGGCGHDPRAARVRCARRGLPRDLLGPSGMARPGLSFHLRRRRTAVVIEPAEDAQGAHFDVHLDPLRHAILQQHPQQPRLPAPRSTTRWRTAATCSSCRTAGRSSRKCCRWSRPISRGIWSEAGWSAGEIKRLWLHQANKAMNDFIGRKVLGRVPEAGEQPNILQDYANTSSAGSIIAFSQNSGRPRRRASAA